MSAPWSSAPELAEMLAGQLDSLVPELLPGARPSGGYWTCGNVQGDPGGSLYLHRSGHKLGKWTDTATGEFGDLLDLVNAAFYGGSDMRAAMKWASGWLGLDSSNPRPAVPAREARPKPHQHDGDAAAIDAARAMWAVAQPGDETLAERYLRHRAATTTPLPPTLRYAPALMYHATGTPLPALVAAISGPGQKVTAVQRIYLRLDGLGKAGVAEPKLTLGRMLDGACRLAPAGLELGLAEGVETGLSAMELYGVPVWAACGSRMDAVAIPDTVKHLIVFGDNGEAGRRAAERAEIAHAKRGRRIELRFPAFDIKDWNDVAQGMAKGEGGMTDDFEAFKVDAVDPFETVDDLTDGPAPKVNLDTTDTGMPPDPNLFTAEYWASRDLAPPDFLLSELLTTTSRMLLIGPTGSGKTNFAMAVAFAIASGSPFLHWTGRRAARVLYIDGEMSARLAKDRVQQAIDRHGSMPETLWVINRHDFPDMPAFNEEAGQKFVEWIIESLGGVDAIVFDNIQAVLVGSQKEDETWLPVLPWIKKLTAMTIGQLWMHHTGHATDRGYGDKTREWQFDTVALMKVPETSTPDRFLEFRLEFTKKRECTPDNRADFETADIWLDGGDAWQSTASPAKAGKRGKKGLSPEYLKALDYLSEAMDEHGKFASTDDFPRGTKVVHIDRWRDRLKQRGLHEGGEDGKKWFQRVRAALIANERIVINEQYVWAVKP